MILDCSSLEATLASLVPLLGESVEKIKCWLLAPKYDPGNHTQSIDNAIKMLLDEFSDRCGPWPYKGIAWFHLTRTSDLTQYLSGIKPVSDVICNLWDALEAACKKERIDLDWQDLRDWIERKSDSDSAQLYRLKQKQGMEGPYAMLLLESALHEETMDNHYLRCPETIEDICNEIKARTGVEIIDAYRLSTKPAVIKFLDYAPRPECTEAAILYAHSCLWNLEYDCSLNVYFDGEGAPVPSSMIVSADYLRI